MDIKHKLQNGYFFASISILFILILGVILWPEPPEVVLNIENNLLPHHSNKQHTALITPIPQSTGLNPDKVKLGQKLFMDTRLSGNNTISCANCHQFTNGGADGLPLSVGINGQQTKRNSPTVFNAALNFRQFWDGRAENLEAQVDGPLYNPSEMGTNWPEVITKLKADADYTQLFKALYTDGITAQNTKNAIATFEYSLLTPDSPFDHFLRGNTNAISSQAQEGYQLFKSYGCIACHHGVNIGGNVYEKLGVIVPYYDDTITITKSTDLGLYHLTKKPEHQYKFKVPSLRNIALTAPYFHDGSIETLDEAIQIMARHQLGLELPKAHQQQIAAFLKSLTGQYNGQSL